MRIGPDGRGDRRWKIVTAPARWGWTTALRSEMGDSPSAICETPSTVAALAGHEPDAFFATGVEEAGQSFQADEAKPGLHLGDGGTA